MPALPAAPGVVRVTMPYTMPSDSNALNRFFIHYTGTAPAAADMAAFATSISNAWAAHLAALTSPAITTQAVTCEDLSSATGAVGSGGGGNVGTRSPSPVPGGTCTMVQFLIARRYRGGKPKIFLPCGQSGDISAGGVWGSAYLTAASSAWGAFQTAVLAAGWSGAGTLTQVNVSYYFGFTVVTNPITHRSRNVPLLRVAPVIDTITGYAVETGVASQRRRNQV